MRHDLPRLSPDEAALYDDLRADRIRAHLRLEQERVRYSWVLERLGAPEGVCCAPKSNAGRAALIRPTAP